jgi:hypothetical protein
MKTRAHKCSVGNGCFSQLSNLNPVDLSSVLHGEAALCRRRRQVRVLELAVPNTVAERKQRWGRIGVRRVPSVPDLKPFGVLNIGVRGTAIPVVDDAQNIRSAIETLRVGVARDMESSGTHDTLRS